MVVKKFLKKVVKKSAAAPAAPAPAAPVAAPVVAAPDPARSARSARSVAEVRAPRNHAVRREGRIAGILRAPVISEKSTAAGEKSRTAVFRVLQDATKPEIRLAVEKMFEVKVASVRVVNTRGRATRFRGRFAGHRSGWRKAYVRLAPGEDINFAELR